MSDGTVSAYHGFNHAGLSRHSPRVRRAKSFTREDSKEQIARSVVVSGGESEPIVPRAKMTVMTKQETALIAASWDLVAQDLKGHGLKFFKQ